MMNIWHSNYFSAEIADLQLAEVKEGSSEREEGKYNMQLCVIRLLLFLLGSQGVHNFFCCQLCMNEYSDKDAHSFVHTFVLT